MSFNTDDPQKITTRHSITNKPAYKTSKSLVAIINSQKNQLITHEIQHKVLKRILRQTVEKNYFPIVHII